MRDLTATNCSINPFTMHLQALFESHHLRLGYTHFVLQATQGRIAQVNYDVIDKFGTDGSRRYRELGLYPRQQDTPTQLTPNSSAIIK